MIKEVYITIKTQDSKEFNVREWVIESKIAEMPDYFANSLKWDISEELLWFDKETEKAVRFKGDNYGFWVPKSQILEFNNR